MRRPQGTIILHDLGNLWKYTLTVGIVLWVVIYHITSWRNHEFAFRVPKKEIIISSICCVPVLMMI